MNSFTTLNAIVTDLLEIIRGAEIARTEPINEAQIESWVHQYRATLLKRDLDKKKLINPDFIQTLESLPVEADGDNFVTVDTIPNTVFRSHEDGFTWIGSGNCGEYQYMNHTRFCWNSYRKYTHSDPIVYLDGGKLYTNVDGDLIVKGLFENPMDVIRLNDPSADTNSAYPIPSDTLTTLKQMILKGELGIEAGSPNDEANDGKHEIK